jgi:hypothetical protein
VHASPIKAPRTPSTSARKLNFDIDPEGNPIADVRAPTSTDPQEREIHDLTLEFCTKQANYVNKEMVKPILTKMQAVAPQYTPKLEQGLKLLVDNDIESSNSLIRSLENANDETVIAAIDSNISQLLASDSTKRPKEAITEQLKYELQKSLTEHFKKQEHAPVKIQPAEIDAFVEWFFNNKGSRKPVLETFSNKNVESQKLFKTLPIFGIRFLTDKKIENTKLIADTIQKKIESLLRTGTPTTPDKIAMITNRTIKDIVGVISGVISDRVVKLTTSLDFENTFDTIVKNILYESVCAQIDAKTEVKADELKIEDTRSEIKKLQADILRIQSENISPIQVLNSSASLHEKGKAVDIWKEKNNQLNEVKNTIKEKEEFFKVFAEHRGEAQYFENAYLDAFSLSPACDPAVKELITRYILFRKKGSDTAPLIRHTEKEVFAKLTTRIIPLLFPTQRIIDLKTGESKEVDFLDYVIEEAEIPKEILELKELVLKLGKEFTSPEINNLLEKVQEPLISVIKGTVKIQAEKIMREHVAAVVENICHKFVDPKKVDEAMANTILPILDELLMQKFTQQIVHANLKEATNLFYAYLSPPENRNKKSKTTEREALENFIGNKLAEACECTETKRLFNAKKEVFIKTEIETTRAKILAYHQECNETFIKKERIEEYFALPVPEIETNADLGKLATKMIFEVGQWKGKGFMGSFLEKAIAPELTLATSDIRNSKDFFARQLIEVMKWVLDKNGIATPANAPVTEIKIDDALNKTSNIGYDMIMYRANNATSVGVVNWFVSKGTKMYLKDSKPLAELITKIYKHTFQNEIVNLNLVTRTTDAFFRALEKRSDAIEREKMNTDA